MIFLCGDWAGREEIDVRVAVLTYHSHRIGGSDYRLTDHVALAEDLRQVIRDAIPIVSLLQVAHALAGRETLPSRAVAFSFDDGMDADYLDVVDPTHGRQPSFCRVTADVLATEGIVHCPPATSFVIADPAARQEMDKACLPGLGWVNDDWWPAACATGSLLIANHSWDHDHPSLARHRGKEAQQSCFHGIDDYRKADQQIRRAGEHIAGVADNPGLALFAYPFGHRTDYLVREYLPNFQDEHKLLAAFTTEPEIAHHDSNRWQVPRFVCGQHWHSPEGFKEILRCL